MVNDDFVQYKERILASAVGFSMSKWHVARGGLSTRREEQAVAIHKRPVYIHTYMVMTRSKT